LASWLSRRTQSVAGRNKIEYYLHFIMSGK
jgi:hypothetical protein